MAIKVDASRPADALVACAVTAFTQPTPRKADMTHGFTIQKSEVDTHIPNLSVAVTPVNNTADGAGMPIVDYENPPFFLATGAPAGVPAEPTITVAGLGTAVVTITFELPPGTVCDVGTIEASSMTVNGYNRDLDAREEPISNPDYWIGWFGHPDTPAVAGLTAEQLAALWHYAGTIPHVGSDTDITVRASGNVVTITELGGKVITVFSVNWTKT